LTPTPYDFPAVRFARLVAEDPDRLVLRSTTGDLTRRELDRRSDGFAEAIAPVGSAGRPVALLVDDQLELLVAVLGSLKAARPFCILDATHPIPRIREILDDLDPVAIVATGGTLAVARNADERLSVVRVDETNPSDSPFDDVPAEADTPAFIVYTSGSTGRPKGVVRTHGTEAALSHEVSAEIGMLPTDRSAPLYAAAFAASIMVMLRTIFSGATLCLYPMKELNLGDLADWIEREKITVLETIPSLFRSLLGSLPPERHLSRIRFVTLGGEAVTQNDLSLFQKFCPVDARLVVIFASSEGGIFLGEHLGASSTIEGQSVPAGHPICNARVRLVDDDGNDVAPGVSGEMIVESRQVSAGYWRAPELSETKFAPGDAPGVRIVRTGDRGMALPDGRIIFLGRADTQLKIRGFRVDPTEVEMALLSDPTILHAAVVGKRGPGGALGLVAYVVTNGPFELSEARSRLAARLPAHALPSRFVRLDDLPKTVTGKVDRKALENRDDPDEERITGDDDAGDAIEETLRRLWCEALHLQNVGLDDEFFEIGGDSLRAAELFASIEREWDRAYPLTAIVEAGTIRMLAAMIRDDLAGVATAADATPTMSGSEIEAIIVTAWRKALGRPELRADDDYFDSGADSKACLEARDEITHAIGQRFPLALFIGFRTARALADALTRPRSALRIERSVERLRKGSGAPLFCFSGKGSDILKFRPLAERLDNLTSVYAVRGFGLGTGWLPPADFDLIVELAADEIRDIQPRGPYRFAGHSSGGQLALEVARRFANRGESIELLAMIDTVHPKNAMEDLKSFGGRFEALWRKVIAVRAEPGDHFRSWLRARRMKRAHDALGDLDHSAQPDRWRDVGDIYLNAVLSAEHDPWSGPVLFFDPESSGARRERTGWEELLPNLEVVTVGGGHVSVLEEPHVAAVAREIGARLAGTLQSVSRG